MSSALVSVLLALAFVDGQIACTPCCPPLRPHTTLVTASKPWSSASPGCAGSYTNSTQHQPTQAPGPPPSSASLTLASLARCRGRQAPLLASVHATTRASTIAVCPLIRRLHGFRRMAATLLLGRVHLALCCILFGYALVALWIARASMRGRLLCLHTSNLPCSTTCHLTPRYRVPLCIRYWRALLEDDFPHVFIHPAPTSTPDSAFLVSVHTIPLTVHPAPATHNATTSLIAAHAAARAVHPAPATHATTAPHGVHLAPSAHPWVSTVGRGRRA